MRRGRTRTHTDRCTSCWVHFPLSLCARLLTASISRFALFAAAHPLSLFAFNSRKSRTTHTHTHTHTQSRSRDPHTYTRMCTQAQSTFHCHLRLNVCYASCRWLMSMRWKFHFSSIFISHHTLQMGIIVGLLGIFFLPSSEGNVLSLMQWHVNELLVHLGVF